MVQSSADYGLTFHILSTHTHKYRQRERKRGWYKITNDKKAKETPFSNTKITIFQLLYTRACQYIYLLSICINTNRMEEFMEMVVLEKKKKPERGCNYGEKLLRKDLGERRVGALCENNSPGHLGQHLWRLDRNEDSIGSWRRGSRWSETPDF